MLDIGLPQGPAHPSTEAVPIEDARMHVPGPPDAAGIKVAGIGMCGGPSHLRLDLAVASDAAPFVGPDLFVEGVNRVTTARPRVVRSSGLPVDARQAYPSIYRPTSTDGSR